MKILSKISALLAAGAIMANTVWVVGEQPIAETQPELDIAAPSAMLIHTSGKVIYARNEHDRRAPASVTKIMTLLLTLEAIGDGRISWDDTVTASSHAESMRGSRVWLKAGEQMSVRDMVKCVAVASANDCSVALAEHIGGSEEAFVSMMNERAARLGMNDTSFVNACGLDAPGHYTSAYDVALMSLELMKHEEIFDYTTIWMDSIRNGAFELVNTNKMIRAYDGMMGLKTGYTSQAGYCLSAAARRENTTFLAVVLGGETSKTRNRDIAALLNYGFANYKEILPSPDDPLDPIPVKLGKKSFVMPEICGMTPVLVKKNEVGQLTKEVILEPAVSAPVEKGRELGWFSVYSGEEMIANVPVTASEGVEKQGFMGIWRSMLASAFMREKGA